MSATLFFVTDDAAGSYRFTENSASTLSVWVRVECGDLPVPIDICVGWAPDGRRVFNGLRIEAEEITSNTLRQIRLSEILAAYFEHFEPIWEVHRSLAEFSVPLPPPGRGPDGDTLMAFARTYATELARQPQRAMTAAANAHNISRATANRWAALCREYGYLDLVRRLQALPQSKEN
jgi:hypothetical protein